MQYMGSKNRLAKEIVPIIQSYIDNNNIENYLEPFVGGANVIDKIKCKNKYGSDNHKELIALLNYAQKNILPLTITEEEYNLVKYNKEKYEDWYIGLVAFLGSFGAKYFGGFARRYNKDGSLFDVPKQAINSLRKQSNLIEFKNITFKYCDFREINEIENFVIYCDIPYKNTTKYSTSEFPYEEFYDWCIKMSKNNIVLISEYNMPNNFECIWEKEHKVNFDSNRIANDEKNIRIEKLFVVKK